MRDRSWISVIAVSFLFMVTWSYTKSLGEISAKRLNQSLSTLPLNLGKFHGRSLAIDDYVSKVLGATEMLSRVYVGPEGREVSIFVTYHGKQTREYHPHSPKLCMPGSGWVPAGTEPHTIQIADGVEISAARAVYAKNQDRQVVLYWYQTSNRSVGNEYLQKISMVTDGILRHRTDVAFIRLSTNVDRESTSAAEKRLEEFVKLFVPVLNLVLPQ